MNYDKRLQELKFKYFPELKNVEIDIKPLRILKKVFMVTLPFSKTIYYNKIAINQCNEKVLKAVIIHELYHLLQFRKLNIFQKLVFLPRYHIFNYYRIKHELEAHTAVVLRGFGEELIELNKFVISRYPRKIWDEKLSNYYLTEEKIIKLMKKKEAVKGII
ncbi:MAG: hypothetical protein KAW45_00855 [Thermoplasmatales archaeon]|nr:hypothetical protein [Thermoplasmatales archaeon]